jgi:7-keto-8-aminopelargonate synthetase-like enzyme
MNRFPKKLKDKLDKRKQDNGFGVYPILPPTIPKGKERLRFACIVLIPEKKLVMFYKY